MPRTLLCTLPALLLAGCAVHEPKHGTTYDAVKEELAAATERRPQPPAPEAVTQALLPPLRVEMPQAAGTPADPRFDLAVNAAPAREVLLAIVSGTRYSMLVHPDVQGSISVNLKDVTVLEALEAIRELYGYEYKTDGARIFVQPAGLQTRIFQVSYLAGQRRGQSELRVTSSSVSDGGPTVGSVTSALTGTTTTGAAQTGRALETARVTTTGDADFWAELGRSLQAIVGTADGRQVVVSPHSGVIVVRALPEELRGVQAFLRASQVSVERQVMLEAKILEVQLNDAYQAGINWAAFNLGSGARFSAGQLTPDTILSRDGALVGGTSETPRGIPLGTPVASIPGVALGAVPNAAGTLFGLALQTSNFAALLSFLESQGNVHVLSSPRIAALNNQKAVLKVGEDELFVTNVSSTTTTGTTTTTTPSVTLQSFFSGIALDVTPRIDDQDNIILHIHPAVSSVVQVNRQVEIGGSIGAVNIPVPRSSVSETDSVVRARDGQIVALGGLMRQSMGEERSGVPGLSDLPFVGTMFRSTTQKAEKRELVILLKPTVIRGDGDWARDIRDTRERVERLDRGYSYGGKTEVFGTGAERRP